MYMYLVVGAPGMGKSPFAQEMIKDRRCLVFDVNNEYGSRTKYGGQTPINLGTNIRDFRSRYIGWDVKQFTEEALRKQNTVIIMEEATAFFRGRQTALTSRLIIGRKHSGNILVFLFHSINRVPPELMEMAEWLILFKTNDELHTVYNKYPRVAPHYAELQDRPAGEHLAIKLI